MDKWVAVTGALGFIGAQTCAELKEQGYKVLGIDKSKDPVHGYIDKFINDDFNTFEVINTIAVKNAVAVIHLAGASGNNTNKSDVHEFFRQNSTEAYGFAFNVQYYTNAGFLYASSAAVYGHNGSDYTKEADHPEPIDAYGSSKLAGEIMIRGLMPNRSVVFRYFNVCGADPDRGLGPKTNRLLMPRLVDHHLNNTEFQLNGVHGYAPTIRDYIHVKDVASINVLGVQALENGHSEGVYNIGTGIGVTNEELYNLVAAACESTKRPNINPEPTNEIATLVADTIEAEVFFDFEPEYSVHDAVRDLVKFRKQQ